MMSDKDIEEYHNIGKAIKFKEKYTYVDATRIEEHGTRLYDVNGSRLPSVTTILGATKDQQFLKDWKAKVGEKRAERIKNHSSRRGTSMHKFIESYVTELATMILQNSDRRRSPWPKKLLKSVLHRLKSIMARKLHCIILGYMLGSTDLVCNHNGLESIVDFKQANRPKKKNGLKIIFYRLLHMPWLTIMSMVQRSVKV